MSLGSRRVAVMGANGAIGRFLVSDLVADPNVGHVLALLDTPPVERLPRKAAQEMFDAGAPEAAGRLADLIDEADVDTLVHLGYLSESPAAQDRAHAEVEVLADALRRRPVPKLVYASTTAVCGALPGDPTHLGEMAPLVETAESAWLRDKVAAERAVQRIVREADALVTVLRLALVIGPTVRNFMTEYLDRSAVPTVIGVDPPVQFLHERDAAVALHLAVRRDYEGVFNIVGDGAVPLSVALRIGRRRPAPVPGLGSLPITQLLWDQDLVETPAVLIDLFKYVWVADGTKAADEMGFQPSHSTKETIEDFYRVVATV